jgi:hypothetical protein
MKKNLLIILYFILTISIIKAVDITFIKGTREDAKVLKEEKKVSIVLDYEKTLLYETNMYEWYENQNKKAGAEIYDMNWMINSMLKAFNEGIKKAKKWDLKLYKNKSDIKKGYIIYIVIDKMVVVPALGYNSQSTINCFKAGSDDLLFKAELKCNDIGAGDTERILKLTGELTSDRLVKFLNRL